MPQTQPTEAATDTAAKASTDSVDTSVEQAETTTVDALTNPLANFGNAIEAKLESWLPFLADSPILQGVSILLIFLVLASLSSLFLKRVVARLMAKTETDLDDKVLSALTGPIYITVLSVGLRLALTRVGLDDESGGVISNILASIVVIVWMLAITKIAGALVSSLGQSGRFGLLREDHSAPFQQPDNHRDRSPRDLLPSLSLGRQSQWSSRVGRRQWPSDRFGRARHDRQHLRWHVHLR